MDPQTPPNGRVSQGSITKVPSPNLPNPFTAPASSNTPSARGSTPSYSPKDIIPRSASPNLPGTPIYDYSPGSRGSTPCYSQKFPSSGPASPNDQSANANTSSSESQNASAGPASSNPQSAVVIISSSQIASPGPTSPNFPSGITKTPSLDSQSPYTGPTSPKPQNPSTGPASPKSTSRHAGLHKGNGPKNPRPRGPKSQKTPANPPRGNFDRPARPPREGFPTNLLRRSRSKSAPASPPRGNLQSSAVPTTKDHNPPAGLLQGNSQNHDQNPVGVPPLISQNSAAGLPPGNLQNSAVLPPAVIMNPFVRPLQGDFLNPLSLPTPPSIAPTAPVGHPQGNFQNPPTGSIPNSRNILITRGAQSIGRDLGLRLRDKGHVVCILETGVGNPGFVKGVDPFLPHLCYGYGNIRNSPEFANNVSEACERFFRGSRIDVLITNADIIGPGWPGGTAPDSVEHWNTYLETGMTAAFATIQASISHMALRGPKADNVPGPCIINICPYRAAGNQPECAGYVASRAGVLGLTRCLAAQYRNLGVRVNAIVPDRIEIKEKKYVHPRKRRRDQQPEGPGFGPKYTATVEDLLGAVEYLMGAGFVSGAELVMDAAIGTFKAHGPLDMCP